MDRRQFFQRSAGAALVAGLPLALVDVARAQATRPVRIACLSDAHLRQLRGTEFVRRWDHELGAAIDAVNALDPRPDFAVFLGDLTQSGTRAELDHGAELLSRLRCPVHMVMGEHDYYRDLGAHWSRLFGADHYSFDIQGVHFVVLNSVLTDETRLSRSGVDPAERFAAMTQLGHAGGAPFTVGAAQRAWLARDLAAIDAHTPVVVFSHAPLQAIHKPWNFWTDDAPQVQSLLARFEQSTVVYGHVHQVQYNRIGNTSFHGVAATAWPRPYPTASLRAAALLPRLTVPMNRAGGAIERDVTGWQLIDVSRGEARVSYQLGGARERVVAIDRRSGAVFDQYSSHSMA